MTNAAGYLLAFDVGTRMIGVAIGHPLTRTARALTTVQVHHGSVDWKAIDAGQGRQPVAFVVGLPLALDGSEQEMTGRTPVRRPARQRYARAVHESDERYNRKKQLAIRQPACAGTRSAHGADIDALAAQIILESWLEHPDNTAFP
jgi:putative Holliday junction resolvase